MINLLDGLRDLKAPLASGLIILFGFWLIFANEVASAEPGQSIAGNIRQLVTYLGAPATLGLVAFLAYIIGIVLSMHRIFWHLENAAVNVTRILLGKLFRFKAASYLGPIQYSKSTGWRLDRYISQAVYDAKRNRGWTDQDIEDVVRPRGSRHGSGEAKAEHNVNFRELFDELRVGITVDIDLLAIQLHAERDNIYEKYDKSKTESDFRAAVILPILFVAAILIYRLYTESNPVIAILLAASSWLMAAGLARGAKERLRQANEVVLNSLVAGNIKSSRLMIFDQPPPPRGNKEAATSATTPDHEREGS